MPIRVLRDLGRSVIVGDEHGIRIVDRPKRCTGYQFCCNCEDCLDREERNAKIKRPDIARCECEAPMMVAGSPECFRCGKATMSDLRIAA